MSTQTRKICAAILTAAMVLSMSVSSVFADPFDYTDVNGTNTTFDKYLIMETDANVPDVTFEYSIAPGTAVAYNAGSKVAIYAGNDANRVSGTPSISALTSPVAAVEADFNPGDTTYTSVQTGDQVTLETGEKYAKKTIGIDFSQVVFKEPGIYRYIVTETSAGQQAMTYDTQAATPGQKTRILDVYVLDDDGTLVVQGYILHETPNDIDANDTYGAAPAEQDLKSMGFVNEYETHNLTFSKTVRGNSASRDQYFKFTVAITGAGANSWFDVDFTNASQAVPAQANTPATLAEYVGQSNSADLTNGRIVCDSTGAKTVVFYLQHGESITIKGLPKEAKYTITEVQEDYKPSATTTGDADAAVATAGNEVADTTTGITADTTNAFTNTKGGVVPTGIWVAVGSGVAFAIIGGAGLVLSKKRRKEDEDEE